MTNILGGKKYMINKCLDVVKQQIILEKLNGNRKLHD